MSESQLASHSVKTQVIEFRSRSAWLRTASFVALLGLASCGPSAAPSLPPAPTVINWDFSQSNLLSNIPQKLGYFGGVWLLDGGGRLNLKCPNGVQGSIDFRFIYVVLDPKHANRVAAIQVFLEMQPRAAAAATALALAKQWGIANIQPLDNFRLKLTYEYGRDDAWFDTIPRDPTGQYLNQPCPFFIEIKSFGHPNYVYQPKLVAILSGPLAATQPATQATSAPTP